jgi:hypothetical protein
MNEDNLKKQIVGKDELNLIEVPFTLLTNRSEENQRALKFTDKQNGITRHWKITGSEEYGLPCALDEAVYISMLALSKKDEFRSRRVFFNQYEVLKLMKWPTSKEYYNRLVLALKRFHGTSIYTDFLWNDGKFENQEIVMGFHIIDDFLIVKGKKSHKNSYLTWSEKIFNSFLAGNLKNLDLEVYFDLRTPISKRFYRLWNKRLYKTDCISFNLKELAHEKLGISRNIDRPSLLKQMLKPAIEEYKEKKLIEDAEFKKAKDKNWLLVIKKPKAEVKPIEDIKVIKMEQLTLQFEENPLINKLVSLDVARKVAESLVNRIDSEIIENQIEALPLRNNIDNKPAFLVKAILENYPLPDAFKKKLSAKEYEKETKLKEIYHQFIIDQVDIHLQKCDQAEIERDIEEFKPKFMEVWNLDEIAMQGSIWKAQLEHDYKFHRKAKTLNLPSFEDWKANNHKAGVFND